MPVTSTFLLFPQCIQKASFSGSLKLGLCGMELMKTVFTLPDGIGQDQTDYNMKSYL